MANKNLKSITFPQLPDTYVVPQVDDTLAITGRPADAKATGDEIADVKRDLNDKANIDGTYDGMTVGSARQLLSEKYLLDEEPYLFRASGGDGSDRVEECIVGGSMVWNQLLKAISVLGLSDWRVYDTAYGNMSYANGELTYTFTQVSADPWPNGILSSSFIKHKGHKLFVAYDIYVPKACNINKSYFQGNVYGPASVGWNRSETIQATNASSDGGEVYCIFGITNPQASGYEVGDTYKIKNAMLIDLTTLFGSTIADYIYSLEQATAGAGVAWFKKYFPEDYYPYCAPTLKHVEGVSQKEVVGFNQWDEEWEVGGYNNTTGEKASTTNQIRSKNAFNVIEGATYYFKSSTNGSALFFDFDGNYIGFTYDIHANQTFVVPSGIATMRFKMSTSYGTTYNHDVCISLSDPTKNGVYEPYHKNIYPLDSSLTLRGIPKLADGKMYFDGDKYNADGTVQRRYGIVDLGTLTWNVTGAGNMRAYINAMALKQNNNQCCLMAQYTYDPTNGNIDKTYWNNTNGTYGAIYIRDTSYTDAASFKTAMSEVYLVYELSTPTTETATPYTALQALDPHGTEEFLTTGIVPVGHYSKYLENLRSKIEGLPKDFSTLIAPTEKEYKATRNYTVGSLLIVDNILYKVTSAIANGGTITPNTNVTATTLAAVIAALA